MKNLENYGLALTNGKIPNTVNFDELDIFEIIESGIFDGVPGLGEIISTYKGFMDLRDKIFMKKFLRFLQTYNAHTIDEEKLVKFRNKIKSDKKYRTKITETLIEYIDDYKSAQKVEIYSNLFTAYINDFYDWEYFLTLSDCLRKVNLKNLNVIPKIDTTEGKEVTEYDESEVSAESDLVSAGLAIQMSVWSSDTYPTCFGKDLLKYGLK
ncbi:hypothetical protein Palpr_2190 [Paludibacter propionicigenes WB4]|uniref:Uncharacterized protein n=1 Tax=Paludibacter propionicigenes (strain DSM 17365 / JCM 13257 / WB4) TaxID=694427 RepID=E4T6I2_PALPW|nr:hypothetical protein [Paludibacter propionicigenes]ADQ80326.1 hypothetical protein Palpr_2190 [Paludibacter propionicigenes WB4]